MIVKDIVGSIKLIDVDNKAVDILQMQWFETTKRIQRKHTQNGVEVAIKFLKEGQRLQQGDIVYMDDNSIIVVDILPCDAIVVTPASLAEMGAVCYEIGNKHLPVFIQNNEVLLPFEEPIFRWLSASGYNTKKTFTKLLNLVNAGVQPHSHSGNGSLFSKIMMLTSKQ
jgi:urease accessory protein